MSIKRVKILLSIRKYSCNTLKICQNSKVTKYLPFTAVSKGNKDNLEIEIVFDWLFVSPKTNFERLTKGKPWSSESLGRPNFKIGSFYKICFS